MDKFTVLGHMAQNLDKEKWDDFMDLQIYYAKKKEEQEMKEKEEKLKRHLERKWFEIWK
jgi:hypothetical protein